MRDAAELRIADRRRHAPAAPRQLGSCGAPEVPKNLYPEESKSHPRFFIRGPSVSIRAMSVSVVCPFYNESKILDQVLRNLLTNLAALPEDWEVIVVNDGSTDGSWDIAKRVAAEHPRLKVLGYEQNRGRGFGLRTGLAQATGDVIITTEIDLSWGDTIVHDLLAAMRRWPDAEIVVASPHLAGGGYKNVPPKRVFLSHWGNKVIRACVSNAVTMNTGMTRAYRREVIQSFPLFEDGKEFHLEVILKAIAFGCRIREIPAILEWKDWKQAGKSVARKSSSKVNRLIVSHTLFSVFANPVRYVWAISAGFMALAVANGIIALVSFLTARTTVYAAMLCVLFFAFSMVLFVLSVVVKQGNMIQRELWILQRHEGISRRTPARWAAPAGARED
jgi:glycosyltransferase involved in cell wall biosynthesis